MKRSFHSLICFSILLFILTGCDKKTKEIEEPLPLTTEIASGLPSNKEKISGYLYASATTNSIYLQNIQYYFNAVAVFGDPQRNLMNYVDHYFDATKFVNVSDRANVNLGQVSVNGKPLSFQSFNPSEVVYSRIDFQNTPLSSDVTWITEENGAFKPLNQSVPRAFPEINAPFNSDTININQNLIINFSAFISNADSVTIGVIGSQSSNNFLIKKSVPYSKGVISFTSQELQILTAWFNLSMHIQAFNYSNRTVEDKLYVFELSRKSQLQVFVTN